MTPEIFIKRALNASLVTRTETIQGLWSGYGEIIRFSVEGSDIAKSVVLKSIKFGQIQNHPRGWKSSFAHDRKVKSYKVEANWYQEWSAACTEHERLPNLLASFYQEGETFLLLEDLDVAGFGRRCDFLSVEESTIVINWLASFHARFLQTEVREDWPEGLWPRGTYWHLATRPDEWKSMSEGELKEKAKSIDHAIDRACYQTLVHGDAKLANFCFSDDLTSTAAVDFQYIGRGIGVQDLAYFLGSCFSESELNEHLDYLLELYFSELSRCILATGESPDTAEAVAAEWHGLFSIAWADFHRFILGWSPTHKKNTLFSRKMTEQALSQLRGA
ncbi:phosphotransferase [Marinomonas sp. GJ51-6]|uniref:phosphotransferase n=1 Tax=Marinomonas sp. GJ51-6 TaxID=2992802 RepID=UPI002934D7D6|nr:phosphotransferase [Marinomonas sp. GJ51-6]WOD08343.1 oxidoreductase family protein [Marinomonas sp. GJ51-6]